MSSLDVEKVELTAKMLSMAVAYCSETASAAARVVIIPWGGSCDIVAVQFMRRIITHHA